MAFGTYCLNILVALDRAVNAAQRGDPNETLSSVAYRKCRDGERFGFMRAVIDKLFWFDPEHCWNAYLNDRKRVLPK